MSFSSDIKTELYNNSYELRHCNLAVIGGVLLVNGKIEYNEANSDYYISISSENKVFFNWILNLIETTFNIKPLVTSLDGKNKLEINNGLNIIVSTGLLGKDYKTNTFYIRDSMEKIKLKETCCKRAFLKSIYLQNGSISNPNKNYHLELVFTNEALADQVLSEINFFDLNAKKSLRKTFFIVYIKEGSKISDFLNIIGAHIALLKLESLRVVKDVRNNINRKVNCELANLNKTIEASMVQRDNINFLINTKGIQAIPKNLRELAMLRLEHEDASLRDLGLMLDPVVSRSGVNYRLNKINKIAEELRGE